MSIGEKNAKLRFVDNISIVPFLKNISPLRQTDTATPRIVNMAL